MLIIGPNPFQASGYGTVCRYLGKELCARGHDITHIAFNALSQMPMSYEVAGKTIRIEILRTVTHLGKVIKEFTDDKNILFIGPPNAIHHYATMDLPEDRSYHAYTTADEPLDFDSCELFNRFDRIIVPSKISAGFYEDAMDKVIDVVPYGVNHNVFSDMLDRDDKRQHFGIAGDNTIRKQLGIVIEAFNDIIDEFKDAQLWAISSGMSIHNKYPVRPLHVLGYKDLRIPTDKLHFHKATSYDMVLSEEEFAGALQNIDAIVLPSRGESFSLVTMEACAVGCINIITDNIAPSEYLKDNALYIDVERDDYLSFGRGRRVSYKDLVNKMKMFCSMTSEDRMRMRNNAKKQSLKYTWGKTATMIEKLVC